MSALNRFKKIVEAAEAAEAAGMPCCEDCGASMTAVELPNGNLRAWIDHTADCPEFPHAGVFTLTPNFRTPGGEA